MKAIYSFFLFVIFLSYTAKAQDVISVSDLAGLSKNPDVIIVWAGDEDGYKVHITGSVSVPHMSLCTDTPIKNDIKSASEMAKILGSKGISADKTIVVYDEGSTKYAGRMYWILKYLGAPKVKMLNGNLTAWKSSRKPITGSPSSVAAATFTPKTDVSIISKIDEVKKAIGNDSYVLVDARKPDEFDGSAKTELRKGHIPGAVNVNHETLLDAKGLLKSNTELKTLFESKGITQNKTVILYCETGVRAGVLFLALKGLGYPNVKVYEGAYTEWQATSSNKVE
jgi:thiosulfate/3-mercaptopyruvate sulfurtransferase